MSDVPDTPAIERFDLRRKVHDGDGHFWIVREIRNGYDRRGGTSLIFEREEIVRRVRIFPEQWNALNDRELCDLMG